MLPAFLTCCAELIDRWENKLAGSDGSYELDVWPEFQNLTGDVISRTARQQLHGRTEDLPTSGRASRAASEGLPVYVHPRLHVSIF
jgi:hypothetical protein